MESLCIISCVINYLPALSPRLYTLNGIWNHPTQDLIFLSYLHMVIMPSRENFYFLTNNFTYSGSLNVIGSHNFIGSGTMRRCGFDKVDMTLLEEVWCSGCEL